MTEAEMVGWHHRHDGHEFEYSPGMNGQRSCGSVGAYQADERQVSRGSAGEYQADEQAGVGRLTYRVSGR